MWDHQRAYTAARLDYEALYGGSLGGIKGAAGNFAEVFGVLAEAKGVAARLPRGQVVGAAGGWYIDTLGENSKIDSMPMTQEQVARLYGDANANVRDLVKDPMASRRAASRRSGRPRARWLRHG